MKNEKLKGLFDDVNEAINKILNENALSYFEPFKENKYWYSYAISSYAPFTVGLTHVFSEYAISVLSTVKYLNSIKGVFVKDKIEKRQYKTDEYLDSKYNKVVVKDVRDALKELHEAFKNKLNDFYKVHIINNFINVMIKDMISSKEVPFNFNKFNKFTKEFLKKKRIKWAKEVAESTEKVIKRHLVKGYEEGLSITDIAIKIRNSTEFKMSRAEKIARTEIMSSSNYVDYANYNLTDDVIGYTWKTCNDNRVRSTHKQMEGVYSPKGKPFIVGGYKMLHPGDQSFGAPAGEVINCRCWLLAVQQDREETD